MKALSRLSVLSLGLLIGSQVQAQTEPMDTNLYLENKSSIVLHQLELQNNGSTLMIPRLTLPPESTISIEITKLTRDLELQVTSPEQVNHSYAMSADVKKSPIYKSKDGFVCGVQVVDIPDEDMVASEDDENEQIYCIANKVLAGLQSVEGDEADSKAAFARYAATKDLSGLLDLSRKVQRDQELNAGRIMDIAGAKVGTPLKGCTKGCLVVTSGFGPRKAPKKGASKNHKGLDLRTRSGTPVVAALPGKILANKSQRKGKKLVGYGHYVIVSHPGSGLQTKYAHLSSFKGKAGQTVTQGQVIALSGNTGVGTAPHLHFETLKGARAVNPKPFLKGLIGMGMDLMKQIKILFA
ncbi:MAG: M23 family metallopeptidase [Bdellovibrionaceae bacterium]|nr:M23 family metallopeptidase [Pseudobdellovibrionaceae bacterium]